MPIGTLELSDAIAPDVEKALEAGLIANARAKNAPPYQETPLQIVSRDEAGRLIAGLTGKTFWNWLYIDILWASEESRGQGLGAKLIKAAEDEALARACHSAYVWTEDFEAEGFYVKQGYAPFVVKNDFPNGHTRIGLMKRLAG